MHYMEIIPAAVRALIDWVILIIGTLGTYFGGSNSEDEG